MFNLKGTSTCDQNFLKGESLNSAIFKVGMNSNSLLSIAPSISNNLKKRKASKIEAPKSLICLSVGRMMRA